MRPRKTRTLRLGSAALLALAGLACAGGPTPRDHFYRLDAGAPPDALPAPLLPGTLEVQRFLSEAVTGGREILYRPAAAGTELRHHSYHRWTDPPPLMLQAQLAAYLRAARAASSVVTPEFRVEPDFVLVGRIRRLERVLGANPQRVVLELELAVTRRADRELLLHRIYREEREVSADGVGGSVAAINAALEALFARFLADLGRP